MTPRDLDPDALERAHPRDNGGHFVPRDCPECGCGRLQYEGDGYWRCDGLADPEDANKELEACAFSHFDGQPYAVMVRELKTGVPGKDES